MSNAQCDMCEGTGEGSGGYKGECGYCHGTGEGTCNECGYRASETSPAECIGHGVSEHGLQRAASMRAARRAA